MNGGATSVLRQVNMTLLPDFRVLSNPLPASIWS